MTVRGFGLVSLLLGLVLVGALWAMHARTSGPTSQQAQQVEGKAKQVAVAVNVAGAAIQLDAYHAAYGTYVGTPLPPSFGVRLVRADVSSYCFQTTSEPVEHVAGPGAQAAAAGPC